MLRYILLSVAFFLLALANNKCIDLNGSCLNDGNLASGCFHGDPREDLDCPHGSTCCLPLGALCKAREGECLSDCKGGKLIDPDLPCAEDRSCCVSRVRQVDFQNTPPRAEHSPTQESSVSLMDQINIAALMTQDIPLTIVLALAFFILFAFLGWGVAYRKSRRSK